MNSTPQNDDQRTPAAPDEEYYYFEGDRMIYTAAFHLKRGCCCHSGCRHCPYGNSSSSAAGRKRN